MLAAAQELVTDSKEATAEGASALTTSVAKGARDLRAGAAETCAAVEQGIQKIIDWY